MLNDIRPIREGDPKDIRTQDSPFCHSRVKKIKHIYSRQKLGQERELTIQVNFRSVAERIIELI